MTPEQKSPLCQVPLPLLIKSGSAGDDSLMTNGFKEPHDGDDDETQQVFEVQTEPH